MGWTDSILDKWFDYDPPATPEEPAPAVENIDLTNLMEYRKKKKKKKKGRSSTILASGSPLGMIASNFGSGTTITPTTSELGG